MGEYKELSSCFRHREEGGNTHVARLVVMMTSTVVAPRTVAHIVIPTTSRSRSIVVPVARRSDVLGLSGMR